MMQLLCVYLPGNPTIPRVKGICERGVRGGWIGSISSVLLTDEAKYRTCYQVLILLKREVKCDSHEINLCMVDVS